MKPVGGTAIFDAVLTQAKSQRSNLKYRQDEIDRAQEIIVHAREIAESARERWEQCIDFLDEHFPNWESVISEDDLKAVRG